MPWDERPPVLAEKARMLFDATHPEVAWLCGLVPGLIVLLLLGYVVLALRYPGRGPHDWLAGTYLVPR